MTRHPFRLLLPIMVAIGFVTTPSARAAEGGYSNYIPGTYGDFGTALEPAGRLTLRNDLYYYGADTARTLRSGALTLGMDLFPTLAGVAGGTVPDDRVIDGVDIGDLLLGKSDKSGREGFVVYMGNDIFGVKWRNWKLHFKEQNGWNGELRTYTMPRAYNLLSDPQEKDNVFFPHTWVAKAALPQLEEHAASLKAHPPIPTGAPDPYVPPTRE